MEDSKITVNEGKTFHKYNTWLYAYVQSICMYLCSPVVKGQISLYVKYVENILGDSQLTNRPVYYRNFRCKIALILYDSKSILLLLLLLNYTLLSELMDVYYIKWVRYIIFFKGVSLFNVLRFIMYVSFHIYLFCYTQNLIWIFIFLIMF